MIGTVQGTYSYIIQFNSNHPFFLNEGKGLERSNNLLKVPQRGSMESRALTLKPVLFSLYQVACLN